MNNTSLFLINETLLNLTLTSINEVSNPGKAWAPIVVPIFFAVLLFSGIFGNIIIIYIILRHKYMQITPNLYIMNLAIGDLLLLICSAPFTALTYIFDTYPFGTFLCKIDQTSQNLTVGVTIFTLMALSYDRCISIRDPIFCHTNKANRTKRSRIGILLIWSLALLFCIPDGLFTTIVNVPNYSSVTQNLTINNTFVYQLGGIEFLYLNLTHNITDKKLIQVCYPFHEINHDNPHIYMKIRVVTRFIVYFFIPILIIGTFYFLIVIVLLRPFKFTSTVENLIETIEEENQLNNQSNSSNQQQQQQQQKQKQKQKQTISVSNKQILKSSSNRLFKKSLFNNKKKSKQITIYNSIYDDSDICANTDLYELKNINGCNNIRKTSSHGRKLNSVSSMRSSTANYIVNRRHIKARLKIVKMVLFLVIIFIILCLPEHIYYFLWYFTNIKFGQGLLIFRIFSSCAFYAHASIHAYVLFCLSSKFRYYGHNLLFKCNERVFSKNNTSSLRKQNINNKNDE